MTDGVEHLVCGQCNANPTVARDGGRAKVVCHCTHVDGGLDAVSLDEMAVLPEPWEFVPNGGER